MEGMRLKLNGGEGHGRSQGAGWNHFCGLGKSAGFMAKVVLGRLTVSQELNIFGKEKSVLIFTWTRVIDKLF